MHYYVREGSNVRVDGSNRTYTFVEAVAKFGSLLQPVSLLPAYKRARPAFIGCLEQYFVVLRESGPGIPTTLSASNLVPIGVDSHHGDWRGSSRSRGTRGLRGGRGGRVNSARGLGALGRPVHFPARGRGFSPRLRDDSRKRQLDTVGDVETPSKKVILPSDSQPVTQASQDFDMNPLFE